MAQCFASPILPDAKTRSYALDKSAVCWTCRRYNQSIAIKGLDVNNLFGLFPTDPSYQNKFNLTAKLRASVHVSES